MLIKRTRNWIAVAALLWFCASNIKVRSNELDFSDPARVQPPPANAIGFPNRAPDFDVLPGFRNPPPGYGEVAFYWWLGDPLTKERLEWQLDQLALVDGVMGLQINYAHSDRGGASYGLTYPSEPALFSPSWWELVNWFMGEAKKRGMAVSLSDYTLGVGQGWMVDELLREIPDLRGSVLRAETKVAEGGRELVWPLPPDTLNVTAYRLEGESIAAGTGLDLRSEARDNTLKWRAPQGRWRVAAVRAQPVEPSLDPMHPRSGTEYARRFFGQFGDHQPGEAGKGLNFFFSDELDFRVGGHLWNARLAEEFRRRKGYDLLPELPALFFDIGPRTSKVRLDYSDVKVALTEEGYFKPVFDWHQRRGMIYGCDHGGRGRDVVEFGDYFRTQRWNQGPGCDQPGLGSDIIKNKVASSIAHLYERPRVWLEGYYGSGWGTSTEQLTDTTFRNFAMGQNLLTLHGLYYATHGGWWEWAPPCNHFRMPYWPHMKEFFACVKRLSFILSQGRHQCDVAIVYPVAPVEAGLDGNAAVDAAFRLGEHLYRQGIDFDFMDFESLARARVQDQELRVSGERYRVLVLPSMRAARWSTLQKADEFARGGGITIALGALPAASDRAGRNDPELEALVKRVFGAAGEAATAKELKIQRHEQGGVGVWAHTSEQVERYVSGAFPRDFACVSASGKGGQPQVMHRRIGARDVFMVYGGAEGAECSFRATGQVELWNPWTGQTSPLPVLAQTAEVTKLRLPLTEKEARLIVFSPGRGTIELAASSPAPAPSVLPLEGPWEFELKPTMDNRFGDFRWPPSPGMIGAEARQFRYADETTPNPGWQAPAFNDDPWPKATASFGPKFWKLGPLPEKEDAAALEAALAELTQMDPSQPVELGGKSYRWQPYSFSWRWGIENDPGHQGYHGLKEEMHDEFIGLGKLNQSSTATSYEREEPGSRYYLWTSVPAESRVQARIVAGGVKPGAVWLNHNKIDKLAAGAGLNAGPNPLLLRYDRPSRAYFVLHTGAATAAPLPSFETFSPAASWIWPTKEDSAVADRFFRKGFTLAKVPAQARLRITCDNAYTVYLNGVRIGNGSRWEEVREFEAAHHLRQGGNVLAVAGHNDGGFAGLIAELLPPAGESLLATDRTWLCSGSEETGWREANFDASRWTKAEVISNFEDSLWYTHPQGPPHLNSPNPSATALKPGSLEMTWNNQADRLPFDTRPQVAKPAGWYRFRSPPGLQSMTVIACGRIQAWADGREMAVSAGKPRPDGATEFQATVTQPTAKPAVIALRIEQERGCYGGAALPEPIALTCGAGEIALGDWSGMGALASYSGGAWYRKTMALTPEQAGGRATLDLGGLSASAELRVNGKSAGIRIAPPWKFDVTGLVKPGENRVEVLVLSALGGHYTTIPTRYPGSTRSGLLGPARLELRPSDSSLRGR